MPDDLDSFMRRIDALPIPRARREEAKAQLASAFALIDLLVALTAHRPDLPSELPEERVQPLAQ